MVDVLEASGARRPKAGLADLPTSTQSAEKIAAPGNEMAQGLRSLGTALGTLGEKIDQAQVPAAQQAGLAAVGRDENGEPTVELRPFAMTSSDVAFNAAATQGFLSRWTADAQAGLQPLAQQHAFDPAGFKVAAKNYVAEVGKNAGMLRPQVRAAAEKIADQHFLSIQNAAVKQQTAHAKDSVLVDIDMTRRDLSAIARKGGIDTPEFLETTEKLGALYTSLKNNPLFEVAPARADADFQTAIGEATGLAMGTAAVQIAGAQGLPAAEKWLKESTERNEKWSPAQREGFREVGKAALKAWQGENKAQIAANKSAADALREELRNGRDVPAGVVSDTIATATRLGDVTTAHELIAARDVRTRLNPLRGLTDGEMRSQATGGGQSNVQMQVYQTLLGGGLTPTMAFGLMGGLSMESSWDTSARNAGDGRDGSDSIGLAQWNSTRAQALKTFAAARSKDWRDVEVQAQFIVHELGTTERRAKAAMMAAGTVEEAGRAAIGYFRPAGFTWANPDGAHNAGKRIEQARVLAATFGGIDAGTAKEGAKAPFSPQEIAANPYIVTEWLRSQRGGNKEDVATARYLFSGASNALDKGEIPNPGEVAAAFQIADRNPEQLGRAKAELIEKVQGFQGGDGANRVGPAFASAYLDNVMREAQGAPILVRKRAEATKAAIERGEKNLKEDPWSEAARRGWTSGRLAPLDMSSPDAMAAGMLARAQVATAIRARTGDRETSALSPGDVSQVSGLWSYGTPDQKVGVLRALGGLPDDLLEPTLRSIAKDGEAGQLAFVAGLAREAPSSAMTVMRGESALAQNKRLAPADKDWQDNVETSIPMSIAAPERAGARKNVAQAVRSAYAALSLRDGDESADFNQRRMDEAVRIVTGGFVEHNGLKLIPPTRGMSQEQFDRVLWSLSDADFAGAASKSGLKVSASDVRRNFVLRGIADGRYVLQAKSSPAEYLYLRPVAGRDIDNTSGGYQGEQRFILDLKGRSPGDAQPPAWAGSKIWANVR